MIRQDFSRIDPKRRSTLGHRQKQFALPTYQELQYPHRLNFYTVPPTADITLEQFEQWAIDRLRGTWILNVLLLFYLFNDNIQCLRSSKHAHSEIKPLPKRRHTWSHFLKSTFLSLQTPLPHLRCMPSARKIITAISFCVLPLHQQKTSVADSRASRPRSSD